MSRLYILLAGGVTVCCALGTLISRLVPLYGNDDVEAWHGR